MLTSSNCQKGSQAEGKKPLRMMKTSRERRKYASELMDKVKGHIPIVLEVAKDLALETHDLSKV